MAFRSRPDLGPPAVDVTTRAHATAPGYIFLASKKGPGQYSTMIVDDRGQLVWSRHLPSAPEKYPMDFKVQHYKGEPVLTWCESKVVGGHGFGEYVILDSSYREVTRVRAGNGYRGDHHEFLITPQGTALITIYNLVPWDLSPLGGSKDAAAWDGILQEVDIESGEVLFEWHTLDHVGLEESYAEPSESPDETFCYFHINSIDVDHDDNLLVSSRNTFTVYKIDRNSGEVMWRLGGKNSDFDMGPGTLTNYQHDARRQSDGTITIFDNGDVHVNEESRGIVLELDMEQMSARLVREYTHPDRLHAETQGDLQVLPNGNAFIGWGSLPVFSEFSSEGELLFSASFPPEDETYRAFRFPWTGRPTDDPTVAVEPGSDDRVTIYASWNGATEVATWEVLAGPGPDRLEPVGSAPRAGFETAITAPTAEPYVGVRAKNRSGEVLGTSQAVKVGA
jgi:hypothetical protein